MSSQPQNGSQSQSDASEPSSSRSSPSTQHPHSLAEFQRGEGLDNRARKWKELWQTLSHPPPSTTSADLKHHDDTSAATTSSGTHPVTQETARSLKAMYDHELVGRCKGDPSSSRPSPISWDEFKAYLEAKETGVSSPLTHPIEIRPYRSLKSRAMAYLSR